MLVTRKNQIIDQLTKIYDVMKGSLAESSRTCGKQGCKCQRGQLHHGYFFSFWVKGKAKMLYVPKRSYPQVQKLINNWKHHKDLIEELTDINVQLVRKGLFKENDK
jgi:hypothetical protein